MLYTKKQNIDEFVFYIQKGDTIIKINKINLKQLNFLKKLKKRFRQLEMQLNNIQSDVLTVAYDATKLP